MQLNINQWDKFQNRHNGPSSDETNEMLSFIGADNLQQLIDETVPESIKLEKPLDLPEAQSEVAFLESFKRITQKNKIYRSLIGMGYYDTITPGVILRNVLENPGWYTAYTPYQAEIAQGRLEALINFQTMVIDLTGMEIANASLLDEGTAVAEAFSMMLSLRKGSKKKANTIYVDKHTFPQTLDVIKTRMTPLGVNVVIDDLFTMDLTNPDLLGVFIQNPNNNGEIKDLTDLFATTSEQQVFSCVASDLMSVVLTKSPGEMGADIVVGSSQRFGVPMGFGGPHAAFFATKEAFKRQIPGRIIGASLDVHGNNAYRMALQTREQHIRREKATSNICTAQVLLAVISGFYAVYHGPKGIKAIAERIHGLAAHLDKMLKYAGFDGVTNNYFDTLKISIPSTTSMQEIKARAEQAQVNFRYFEDGAIGISLDETTTQSEIHDVAFILTGNRKEENLNSIESPIDENLVRTSEFMTHPVFNSYHSEHEMLRYLKRLENKDLSLVHSMISLGSCTMKLNSTAEMIPVTWPEVGKIHPYAPSEQVEGYTQIFNNLESWLNEITGFTATSLQPNSGAQGEYSGLMVIRQYHINNGDNHRNVALIPSSAHGTNPASAVMAGMKVVIVACDDHGNIDLEDLKAKALEHKENLGALMVTYPSTHGVFEEAIKEICDLIHENGGMVYMDGANMNAQVGLTSPANIGADVCHLNLHKTFCIPHGGGGPGMGPICVNDKLAPFLPGNPLIKTGGEKAISAVSAAPWGSASILAISYAYIAMMGGEGLTNATELAILNSNYIKNRLSPKFDILYTGKNDRTAHEFIVDCRQFKEVGIEVEDIAKRLMDYGFHAPTVSFPVAGTIMIEPTESESKEELDRFCDALLSIREEIAEIESGKADQVSNVLKNAPHTAAVITADEWNLPYSRQKAAYPLNYVKDQKFWPTVGRIDSAYGDRNLVCSCLPIEAYQEEELEMEA